MKIEDCKIGMTVGVYSKTHGVITGKLIDLIEGNDNIFWYSRNRVTQY